MKHQLPIFSVIIATYNGAETIREAIDSISRQNERGTLFEIELIVVDDCSTDNTTDIVRQTEAKLYSTSQNSGGPNRGRNIGLEHVTGDYICIVDQDDTWHPQKLQETLPYLQQVPIVTSGFEVVDRMRNEMRKYEKSSPEGYVYYPVNKTFIARMTKTNSGQITYLGSITFDASLKDIRFEEEFGAVDYDWVLRLFYHRDSIEICQSLYTRHVSGRNLSLDPVYRRNEYNYSLNFIDRYAEEFPEEVKFAKKRINGSRARYFYMMKNMKEARRYFKNAETSLINILYYITTYFGSEIVRKNFNVFGS